ncbi:helix-turn-helix transcriptional regulator [Puia sp.]|jgi:AraC-like DNA-binding protein|uniref:helix-turn-helix transcriptional regulator n=1 Tax=Puia sp. TaxID=2045100 RepID=UPI002F3FE15E
MSFTEYRPAEELADHIDAYWVRQLDSADGHRRRVYADGCADVLVNTGNSTAYYNPLARLDVPLAFEPGQMYLAGTMTAYGIVSTGAAASFAGVRFKAGGLFAMFGMSMADSVDSISEFSDNELFELLRKMGGSPLGLDDYFRVKMNAAGKRRIAGHDFISIYKSVYHRKGQVAVEDLAKEWHVSKRTLERIFRETVGIPPKEFITIIRFQEVLRRLRQLKQPDAVEGRSGVAEESLLRLAFELGYYDHAHLTHEFKRYAGLRPSELSRFYKTGIASGQYF